MICDILEDKVARVEVDYAWFHIDRMKREQRGDKFGEKCNPKNLVDHARP